MNFGASAYVPSPSLRAAAAAQSRSGTGSLQMTPLVVPSNPHITLTPGVGPHTSGQPPLTSDAGGVAAPLPISAADHLRQLHQTRAKSDSASGPGGSHSTTASSSSPSASAAPPPAPTGSHQAPRRVHYTKAQLVAMQSRALDAVRHGPITDEPPFLKIPATFAPLLRQPFALEYVDVDAATALVEGRSYASPLMMSASSPAGNGDGDGRVESSPSAHPGLTLGTGNEGTDVRNYHCPVCSQGGAKPCPALAEVIRNATRYAMRSKEGACLLQSPMVVTGLLQLLLVFESKKSSMRMRLIAETHPAIVRRVTEYLCGEGYHLPLPSVTAHESWRTMMSLLKFDAIRDNRTRIIHDFSKHWKKRHTPFEQFVYFFSFRYAVPAGPAKNIPTCSVKPGMVAMLSGDVMAMVLLHHLNFFIPPDYYWTVYPYLRQALGEGTLAYDVIRHLGQYFSSQQDPSAFFNPIEDPAAR